MTLQPRPDLDAVQFVMPVIIAGLYIVVASLFKEPGRRNFNAIMLAGAGAAYLNGGLGLWEFAFTPLFTFCAYKGLADYRYIGAGWILHTVWDVIHHLYGNSIVPFAPNSSAGCGICDPVIAVWCFVGAPSVFAPFAKSTAVAEGNG